MAFRTKLKEALNKAFSGAKIVLDPASPGSKRTVGQVVWKGFSGVDQIDRQEKLWKALKTQLTNEERAKVTVILTLAPEEVLVSSSGE